jgi:hypothetical protein
VPDAPERPLDAPALGGQERACATRIHDRQLTPRGVLGRAAARA